MTQEEFRNLQETDCVRHVDNPDEVFIVTDTFDGYAVAIKTIVLINPACWEVVSRERMAS